MDETGPFLSASLSQITSEINRARSPQAIVNALCSDPVARWLEFDCCTLVLPQADGSGLRSWRAWRAPATQRLAAAAEAFAEAHHLLAGVLAGGSSKLFAESELKCDYMNHFGHEAKSALALPLSFGGRAFGLICFSAERAGAYAPEAMERLMWLANHVAATAQALLHRAQLESLTDAQREIDRLKSGFINTLVRDIRLPLTSVLGLLELFESKVQAREPFDTEDKRLLNSAIENGDRMRRLLDDHLEVARQQEQPLTLRPEEMRAAPLLESLVEPLRGEAALRGVELNVKVRDTRLALYVDAKQTRRALCHMLMAALSATPDGGTVNIEAQVITGTRVGDEGRRLVVINISDSGVGLPAEEVPFVFDAFWQAPGTRNNGLQGVGLAIARRIAAAHGGNVTVRSQTGVGTIYSIVLPASQSEIYTEKRRVLVVDDVPDIMLLLGKLVERMGYQVEMASCAAEALEVLEQKEVNLLITDWAMPGMNGGELIARLKEEARWREIPTVVLTGHDTLMERDTALLAGCDCFLVKPVKRDELQRVIHDLLEKHVLSEKGETVKRSETVAQPL